MNLIKENQLLLHFNKGCIVAAGEANVPWKISVKK